MRVLEDVALLITWVPLLCFWTTISNYLWDVLRVTKLFSEEHGTVSWSSLLGNGVSFFWAVPGVLTVGSVREQIVRGWAARFGVCASARVLFAGSVWYRHCRSLNPTQLPSQGTSRWQLHPANTILFLMNKLVSC